MAMPRTATGRAEVVDSQTSFDGGLNAVADEMAVAPNQVRQADNARLTVEGAITKRLGTQRTSSAALSAGTPVRGGYGWKLTSTVQELAVCNGALRTGTFSIGMTWASPAGSLSSSVQPSFAGFRDGSNDVAYIADGGLLNKWNGTTLSADIAGTPAVAQLAVYNLRLFGISGTDDTLYWSALDNGDTLGNAGSGGGAAVVRTFGDQRLTAIRALKSSLLLFHWSGISRFTGTSADDIDIEAGAQGVTSDVGTIAPGSLVDLENGILFLCERGVYLASEFAVTPIASPIESILASLDKTNWARVTAAHSRATREVWIYLPDVGVYVFNYRANGGAGAWTGPWTGGYTENPTYALWESQDAQGRPIVLRGAGDGYVERCDAPGIYKDAVTSAGESGAVFTLRVRCRRLFAGDPVRVKSWREVYIHTTTNSRTAAIRYRTPTLAGQASLGTGATASEWGKGTWGAGAWGGVPAWPVRRFVGGQGPWVDLTITDDGEAESTYSRVDVRGIGLSRRGF